MLDCVSDVLDYAWTGSRCGVALYVRPDRPAPAETDTVYADCPRIRTCVNVGPVSVDFAVRRILWGVCIQDTGYLGFCCLRIRPRIQGVSMRRPDGHERQSCRFDECRSAHVATGTYQAK